MTDRDGEQAVKYGGREEYDAIVKICDKPPNPSAGISAMWASISFTGKDMLNIVMQAGDGRHPGFETH